MKRPDKVHRAALNITHWIGSPQSIVLHTTLFIIGFSTVLLNVLPLDTLLLILNTIVSLEAIYLALFIQLTVNYTTETIEEVGEDIDEIQKDIDEIQGDVDELQEDVEDITEDEAADEKRDAEQQKTLGDIQNDLRTLMQDIDKLQKANVSK